MRRTLEETGRRRKVQTEYNKVHGITPEGIKKQIVDILSSIYEKDYYTIPVDELEELGIQPKKLTKVMKKLKREIDNAAKKWDFERAAQLRDRLLKLEKIEITL
jgi:excinuclease ABC subunit B